MNDLNVVHAVHDSLVDFVIVGPAASGVLPWSGTRSL
jgi:hypothetical protein